MEYCIDKIERVLEYGEICGTIGYGDTLADAIRNAGIRCETCEHYTEAKMPNGSLFHCKIGQSRDDYMDNEVDHDHFCANHSELT